MLIAISDQSQIAAARRAAESFARELGFDDTRVGRVALVATEMASNVLKHAASGDLSVAGFADGTGSGIELLAADKGPGIADVARALEDGYSTIGTPGTGLGAIRRLADIFDVFSRPGAGTLLMARIRRADAPRGAVAATPAVEVGAMLAPYPGEFECGDAWAFAMRDAMPTLLAVDGSGHGAQAAVAARTAIEVFATSDQQDGVRLVEHIHLALAPTRGAAIALARVDAAAGLVRFIGVGNIAGTLIAGPTIKHMVSHNGTAGHVAPRIREFTYPFAGDPTIVMHSDGVSPKWEMNSYPGLVACRPSVIAGVLNRDFRRTTDDALVVVMRVVA
jgi:anti-sigma regulatory factor (Ser/Thr protein kinase)